MGVRKKARTVDEYVKDMLEMGRTPQQITGVAKVTRWNNQLDEVEDILSRLPTKKKKAVTKKKTRTRK